MEKFLVSIIIPLYNAAESISKTLNSVLDQTHSYLEVIIVDDGSTDGGFEIAQSFRNTDRRVKCLARKRTPKGAPTCRNIGISKAKGNYIMFLDADDVIEKNKLQSQLAMLASSETSVAFCNCFLFWENSLKNLEAIYVKEASFRMGAMDWLVELLLEGKYVSSHSWLVPKSIINKTGSWNENLTKNQDGEYLVRLISNAEEVYFCHDTAVYYRKGNPFSITSKGSRDKAQSVLNSYSTYESILKEQKGIDCKKVLARLYYGFYYLYYPMYPDLLKVAKMQAEQYGKGALKPHGSSKVMMLQKYIGWKRAKELEYLFYLFKRKLRSL